MFRKPKSKGNVRKRLDDEKAEDESNGASLGQTTTTTAKEEEEEERVSTKAPPSLLSFDHDEGADDNFEIKKSKKYLKEQKRQKKLEERAAREWIKDEVVEVKTEVKQELPDEDEVQITFKDPPDTKKEDKLRASSKSSRPAVKKSYEEEAENEENERDSRSKFATSFNAIPDPRAVYEARKKREELRRQAQSGYIPLDDDQKVKAKGERERLVREDENDDSDDDTQNFYSAKALLRAKEEQRRENEYHFAEREHGDDVEEMDEFERMQIRKAVSKRNIGELEHQRHQTSMMLRHFEEQYGDNKTEVEMDLDVEDEVISRGAGTGGVLGRGVEGGGEPPTMEAVLARMKLRINDREEFLNTRRYEVNSMQNALEEKEETMTKMRSVGPQMEEKYKLLQRIRIYSRCLIECIDEKLEDINGMSDSRRKIFSEKRERIEKRRRRDIKDCYEECAALAAGKNINSVRAGEHAMRYSDREARRARRRREREGKLKGISHEEGMSSDDEEVTSQTVADSEAIKTLHDSSLDAFSDTLPEYSSITAVLSRVLEWLSVDEKSFTDSFVSLCLPKLCSPFVRLELLRCDPLREDVVLSDQLWYAECLRVTDDGGESGMGEHPVVVGIIPAVIDKVVVPFLTDIVAEEWEPLSLSQTRRLSTLLLTLLRETPTLTERSKSLRRLLQTLIDKINSRVDDDLFVPMFGRQAMDNPTTGCRAFLDRQFWSAIKLLKCINCLDGVLSSSTLTDLAFSVTNRVCVLTLQLVDMSEPHVAIKTRALLGELKGRVEGTSLVQGRALLACLRKIVQEQKKQKDVYEEAKWFIKKLEEKEESIDELE